MMSIADSSVERRRSTRFLQLVVLQDLSEECDSLGLRYFDRLWGNSRCPGDLPLVSTETPSQHRGVELRLLLIRHAEAKRDGRLDHGLTPKGREQALGLAGALGAAAELDECAALLASPLPRAQETVEAIARESDLEILTEPRLCEMGDMAPPGPGVEETFDAFLDRVDQLLCRFGEDYTGKNVMAVTHAGFIVGSFMTRFDVPRPGTGARLEPLNTSVTEWRVESSIWMLASYNLLRGES